MAWLINKQKIIYIKPPNSNNKLKKNFFCNINDLAGCVTALPRVWKEL